MDQEMANRIAVEAQSGSRVLVLAHNLGEARDYLAAIEAVAKRRFAQSIASVRRANGAEAINFTSDGYVKLMSGRSRGVRGVRADVVVVDATVLTNDRAMRDVLPIVQTSRRAALWVLSGPVDLDWMREKISRWG